MKNNTQQKLKLFVKFNNWTKSHEEDMKRFYEFIIEAYKNKDIKISRDEFLEVINSVCEINENELSELIKNFEFGIELLEIYNRNI